MTDSPMEVFLRAVDARDIEAMMSLLAPHVTVTTAFGESAEGIDDVRRVLGEFLRELRATHHDVSSEWNPEPGVWIAEMSATYELSDFSRRGPYERVIIIRAGDHGIEQLRIYGAHELPLPQAGRSYSEVEGPHGWLATL